MNKQKDKIIEGNLELTEDLKIEGNLIVKGNIFGKNRIKYDINARNIDAWDINAGDINARNINARNINAWDIICEKRIKKERNNKTICRIFIQDKSKIKIGEKQ